MHHAYRRYVPALGFDYLTPFHDPLVAATTRERTFKRKLIRAGGPVRSSRGCSRADGEDQ